MSDNEQNPKCRHCGNQMYLTRFQSTVTDAGIDREQFYECLWWEERDFVTSHMSHTKRKELAA
jgi:hypothetical protein